VYKELKDRSMRKLALIVATVAPLLAYGQLPYWATGLKTENNNVAVNIELHDPRSIAEQIGLTANGIRTEAHLNLRKNRFIIRDSHTPWLNISVSLMASNFKYETRAGGPVGVTTFAYSVRVKFGRQVFLIIKDEIQSGSAYVWEEERFGTGEVKWKNSEVIEEAIETCLKDFSKAYNEANGRSWNEAK
jgi:hypothetical protein